MLLQAIWFGWSYQEWSLLEGSIGKPQVPRASQTNTQGVVPKPLKGQKVGKSNRSIELPACPHSVLSLVFPLWLGEGHFSSKSPGMWKEFPSLCCKFPGSFRSVWEIWPQQGPCLQLLLTVTSLCHSPRSLSKPQVNSRSPRLKGSPCIQLLQRDVGPT